MKAAVINSYGGTEVFQIANMETPQINNNQLLVKVMATSINPIDWKIRKGMLKLLTGNKFPLILGFDVSGEVVRVGDSVADFQVGDAIYTSLNSLSGGAYAEYTAVDAKVACPKPENLTHEQAAAVPLAALTALQALRDKGKIQSGQEVLINGASGGVGSFAVQIAKFFSATVTAVCSAKNVELVKSLGADRVIDYTRQDFTKEGVKYNLIFDVVGDRSFWSCQGSLTSNGVYVTTQPTPSYFGQSLLTALFPGKKAKVILLNSNASDLTFLKELIETDKLRPIIQHTYQLAQIAEAHSESERGHVVGKLVVKVAD
jgi:2-desacetyl-2-hydroxyethyl bacteriochlorophyllide A dehydrogenase